MIKASNNQFDMDSGWRNVFSELRRGRGHMLAYILNRIKWNYYYKFNIVPSFPLNIDIEASSRCQLHCEHCFREYMDIKENDLMPMELYRKIVDECASYSLFTLKFSMRGEPTTHPQIVEMVDYAKKKGIKEVWINTNGGLLTEKLAEGFILAGLDCLTVSFDGLREVYESIRVPLKYDETLEKLKKFMEVRKRLKAEKPIVKVQSIWSAIEDNPDEYLYIMSNIVDKVSYNIDFNYKEISLVPDQDYVCYRLWQRMAITSKGDVLKCPSDFEKEEILGNVEHQTIKEIWDTAQELHRKAHLGKKRLESTVCRKCHHGAKAIENIKHSFAGSEHGVQGVLYDKEFKGHGIHKRTESDGKKQG